jgi:homocysteine S-methyltransferase
MTTTLIDGGLSTQLETQGVDLKRYPKLWTAGLLTTAKGQLEVLAAHQHYILAGADIILTSSYQICPFMVNAEDLLVASRDLALQAKDTSAAASQVFLSLGPWGATQADGSEYTGDYKELATQDYLFTFHAKRLSMLLQPGQHQSTSVVDGLAFETIPSLLELNAILRVMASTTYDLPTWISFSSPDGIHMCDGATFDSVVAHCLTWFAAHPCSSPRILGVNCVHPSTIDPFLDIVLPLIPHQGVLDGIALYPNNGGTWDAVKRCWCNDEDTESTSKTSLGFSGKAVEWRDRIVKQGLNCYIGGCCSTDAKTIAVLKERLEVV